MKFVLFPHTYRYIGWTVLIVGLILGILLMFFHFSFTWLDIRVFAVAGGSDIFSGNSDNSMFQMVENNFTDEMVALLILIGSVLVAFSKEKVEDEYYSQLRFEAIVWALKIQSVLLLLAILFLYNFAFLSFMIIALVSFYLLYIGRYHYCVIRLKKASREE